MASLCGADCGKCPSKDSCRGCEATCGKPFGGSCIAAEYIRTGGKEAYALFKQNLLQEINELLCANGLPAAETLFELPGAYINLPYPVPNGQTVKLLDDKKIYLGTQIPFADLGICYGVAADMGFILVSSYSVDGSEPELLLYKKR